MKNTTTAAATVKPAFNFAKYNRIKKAIRAKFPEMSDKAVAIRAQKAYAKA